MDLPSQIGLVSEWLGIIAVTMLFGTSRIFSMIRPLVFLFPRREGILSLYLFSGILVLGVLFFTPALIQPAIQYLPVEAITALLIFSIVCLVPFLLMILFRKQPMLSAGWSPHRLRPSIYFSFALIMITLFLRGTIFKLLDGVSALEVQILLVWIGIALVQETIFRGYMQPRLSGWVGKNKSWLLTASLFTIWSVPRFLFEPHPIFLPLPLSIGYTFFQGILLGWIYNKSGHVAAPGFYRAVSEWTYYLV